MTALKDISMSELAAGRKGLGLVKSGVSKGKEKGEYVDPFTIGQTFVTEITGTEVTTRASGTPQVALSVSIIRDDGSLQKAGKVWVDLPYMPEGLELTAEEEATHMQKSGEKFLRFLRAVNPETWNVFASIDKSDAKKWVYLGFDGQPMSEKARTKKADEIDAAVFGLAEAIYNGGVDFTGVLVAITKKTNPNSPKYPYINFSALTADEG